MPRQRKKPQINNPNPKPNNATEKKQPWFPNLAAFFKSVSEKNAKPSKPKPAQKQKTKEKEDEHQNWWKNLKNSVYESFSGFSFMGIMKSISDFFQAFMDDIKPFFERINKWFKSWFGGAQELQKDLNTAYDGCKKGLRVASQALSGNMSAKQALRMASQLTEDEDADCEPASTPDSQSGMSL